VGLGVADDDPPAFVPLTATGAPPLAAPPFVAGPLGPPAVPLTGSLGDVPPRPEPPEDAPAEDAAPPAAEPAVDVPAAPEPPTAAPPEPEPPEPAPPEPEPALPSFLTAWMKHLAQLCWVERRLAWFCSTMVTLAPAVSTVSTTAT
jgi:hypothetical protein